jgi:hypothetical protein
VPGDRNSAGSYRKCVEGINLFSGIPERLKGYTSVHSKTLTAIPTVQSSFQATERSSRELNFVVAALGLMCMTSVASW